MASGWAADDAVNLQIESSITDAINQVRRQLNQYTVSADDCIECGQSIPTARKTALSGVQHCLSCQNQLDKLQQKTLLLYNRRASKNSQLR